MDWLAANFNAIEMESELEDFKNNPYQHSHTRNSQKTSRHVKNYQNTFENNEQNKTSSHPKITHYYKVIDVQPGASQKDVKQAYRGTQYW